MEKIVVMLVSYNEVENIGKMLEELEIKIIPAIKDYNINILVADDNSPDGTAEIVKKMMKQYKNIFITSGKKEGIGKAFKRGVRYAIDEIGADAVIKMDADFQHNPGYIIDLIAKYREGYEYVIGSRYIKGGAVPREWGFYRRVLSKYGGLFTRILLFFPFIGLIKDVSSGFKLVSVKNVLNRVDLKKISSGYYYTTQLLYQAVEIKARLIEIPIRFDIRADGKTKMPLSNITGTFFAMIGLSLKSRRMLRFLKFLIVGFIGYIINSLVFESLYRSGATPAVASIIGIELAIISNFSINNNWTYKDIKITGLKKTIKMFALVNLASIIVIGLQAGIMELFILFFGDRLRHLFLVITIVLFVLPFNFSLYNIIIWKNWRFKFSDKYLIS